MSEYYGKGVGRHLSSQDRNYTSVVFQKQKPPIAEEFNLLTETMEKARQELLRANIPSGFVSNPFNPKSDYVFDSQASNLFWLGKAERPLYAIVNGWPIPLAGTLSEDLRCAIKLPPPQSTPSSQDVNFVFLEVWKAQIAPQGSINKPSQDQIYRYGNVEFGGQNVISQILDPRVGIATSERVQLQYRIRVVPNVNPDTNPYGFNPSIRSQGPLAAPISSSNSLFQYQNMKDEMGDSGLWRAGIPHTFSEDGTKVLSKSPLETLDGFVYAIPLCLVFRRSSQAWEMDQHLGAVNRNPSMVGRLEAQVFPDVHIMSDIDPDTDVIEVNASRQDTTFPETNGLIKIGEEVIHYSLWDDTLIHVEARGYRSGKPTKHLEGSSVTHVSDHPMGLFSDQIVSDDVLDLRHITNVSGFSYDALLKHNFFKLIQGDLKTSWKRNEGGMKGVTHFQVDQFSGGPTTPHFLERDAPDNFRKVFSDACALQSGNLLVIKDGEEIVSAGNYTFNPTSSVVYRDTSKWEDGDNIRIPLEPFRQTFKTVDRRKVRFVHPSEYVQSSHEPFKIWFDDSNDSLLEGIDKNLIVVGEKPALVSATYLTGLASTITFFEEDEIVIALSGGGVLDFSVPTPQPPLDPCVCPDPNAPPPPNIADYLASLNAYIVIEDSSKNDPTYKGAFRIVGLAQGVGLKLVRADETDPSFGAGPTGFGKSADWRIRLRSCTAEDDEVIAILLSQASEDTVFSEGQNLFMSFDVLYHPNQGMARCPDKALFTRMQMGGGTQYVRPNTPANLVYSTTASVKDFPVVPMESFPHDRSTLRRRDTNDLKTSVEDTWAEVYVDKGSKTALFQPLRQASLNLNPSTNPTGSTSTYRSGAGVDPDIAFLLQDGNPCYVFPKEVLAPLGRIDLPFVSSTNLSNPYGYNFVFSSLLGGDLTNQSIVRNRILAIYDPQNIDDSSYGQYINLSSLGSGAPAQDKALVCRLYDKDGVRGIELPSHFGIARLFGAYERDSFFVHGSNFTAGSHYRQMKTDWEGSNLLKASPYRNLFITENNTFVIPEDVIDVNMLEEDLGTTKFVFEVSCFLFNDWRQDKVQVHVRSGQNTGNQTFGLLMNGPCASSDAFYVVSSRTPYQGDITGTMAKSALDTASLDFQDYDYKEEADQTPQLSLANKPLDRRKARVENPVVLEILTSLPFVTTLGTGRIAGEYKQGSYTDVGAMSSKGFPEAVQGRRKTLANIFHESTNPRGSSSQMNGISERLPTGLLATDHLFAGEGILGTQDTFKLGGLNGQSLNSHMSESWHLTNPLCEDLVVLSDGTHGGNASGVAYHANADMYRTYRGGVLTSLKGEEVGGAVTYSGQRVYKDFPQIKSFELAYQNLILQKVEGSLTEDGFSSEVSSLKKHYSHIFQVHGSVLFGIAFLVRTQKEVVTTSNFVMNHGDELQMLIVTGASFGKGLELDPFSDNARDMLDLAVQLHPTGYGERFCAADRFRIEGRVLHKPSDLNVNLDDFLYRGAKPVKPPKDCP
jgi:hypothetical protein